MSARKRRLSDLSDDDDDDDDVDVFQEMQAMRGAKSRKRRRMDSDDDDGDGDGDENEGAEEAAAAAPEPSDDSDDSDEEFQFQYDSNMEGDDEDKAYLNSLTEIERETVYNQRFDERQRAFERWTLKRELKARRRAEKAQAKAPKENKKTPARRATKTKQNKAMEELKASRQRAHDKKKAKDQQRQEADTRMATSESESEDSDYEDEFQGKRNARMKRVLREEYDARAESDDDDLYGMTEEERMAREPATLENILEIQITRNKMAHWCHQPFFDEAMVGCFVRVGVGLHEGQQTYRCARIVEVQNTQRTYDLEKTKTNKYVVLKFGTSSRPFRMAYVSNTPITSSEYNSWVLEAEKNNLDVPTKGEVDERKKAIEDARSFKHSMATIQQLVEHKRKLGTAPINFAVRREELKRHLKLAQQNNDEEKMLEAQNDLEKLEQAYERHLQSRKERLESVHKINKRNQQFNTQKLNLATANGTAQTDSSDVFSRRVGFTRKAQTATEQPAPASPSQEESAPPVKEPSAAAPAAAAATSMPSSVEQTPVRGLKATPSAPSSKRNAALAKTTPQRVINLSEFKRQNGLI